MSEEESHIDKIKTFLNEELNSKISINTGINTALVFFIDELNENLKLEIEEFGKDVRSFILVSYVIVPSLTLELFRGIMLYFFSKNGINEQMLLKGKWLPETLLLKSKLCKDILVTQGHYFEKIVENKNYFEAIDFFCEENNNVHRNKVAHNFCSSLEAVSRITLKDLEKNVNYIFEFLAGLIDVALSCSKKVTGSNN